MVNETKEVSSDCVREDSQKAGKEGEIIGLKICQSMKSLISPRDFIIILIEQFLVK